MDPAARHRRRPGRRTNLALLVLLPIAVLTGLIANAVGTRLPVAPATIHGIVALAIVALVPWKSVIVRRGLGRGRRSAVISMLLLGAVTLTVGSGLLHITGYRGMIGPLTVMQVHIGGGVLALLFTILHFRSHPVRPRRTDLDRRAFLRTTGIAATATVAWLAIDRGLGVLGWSGADRRFTGSHEVSSFLPAGMPVTSWLDDRTQHIAADDWRLQVAHRTLTLADLVALSTDDVTAVLDCTSAWYSEQVWTGVRLDRLVDPGDRPSIQVTSATGYERRFPVRDLDQLWLVTHVGGEPLSAGHGYPARIVAPGRRGFWWVKWVVSVEPSDVPSWLQLPFPIT